MGQQSTSAAAAGRRRRIEERRKKSSGTEAGMEGGPMVDKKPPSREGDFGE